MNFIKLLDLGIVMTQFQERTNQKLDYAKIHFEELINYQNAMSNDAWENAHQESYFYHLAGAVEGLLHEINDGYTLSISIEKISWKTIKNKLNQTNQISPAYNHLESLRKDSKSWFLNCLNGEITEHTAVELAK